MNKYTILIITGLFPVFFACSSESSDDPVPTPTQPVIMPGEDTCQLLNNSVIIDAAGGERTIVVKTNRSHTLTSTVEWITINDEARAVADYEYTITISENLGAKREGIVEITFEGVKKPTTLQFKVIQSASGVTDKEYNFANGINGMTQNEWEQEYMYKTKDLHCYFGGVGQSVFFDDVENEITKSLNDLLFCLSEDARYNGDIIMDVESGKMQLSYKGGVYMPGDQMITHHETLQAEDAMLPSGFKYGFAIAQNGAIMPIDGDESVIVAYIGTNDFNKLTIKINRKVIESVADRLFSPQLIITYNSDMGDIYTIHLHITFELDRYL
ncbi:MAG: hypothetical protein E7071_07970 [Bacteroidales bacterium]|nr:hypothetical protein [Bacteroidales bacterium]